MTPLLLKGGESIDTQYHNFLLLFRGGVPLTVTPGGRWWAFSTPLLIL